MTGVVNRTAGVMLFSLLLTPVPFAATKEPPKPDREMLRMMEFLKEIELLQQMEMMREMHEVDGAGEVAPKSGGSKVQPVKNKGTSK